MRLTLPASGLLAILSILLMFAAANAQVRDTYQAVREAMVKDVVAGEGVTNPRVLKAMGDVPRHLFVRPNLRHLAYQDLALDLGFKQTISPPFIVAYMTEVLDPQPNDRVLEIGTGSGYQAAVLSHLVETVYTIEIVEPLGKRTDALLKRLKYDNVVRKVGDGYLGWPEHAPFDKIIVTCSPESVPRPLVEQLKEGGKMIIPLGERYQQVFYLFEKKQGELVQTRLLPTLFVPMTGKMEELRKVQPNADKPEIRNGSFEEATNAEGLADGWHYQRRTELVPGGVSGAQCIKFENSELGKSSHILQGMALDGSAVSEIEISWAIQSENIRQGRASSDLPSIVLYLFDDKRIPLQRIVVGPWIVDHPNWHRGTQTVTVPKNSREAIVQVGLNGALGTLLLDDLQIRKAN